MATSTFSVAGTITGLPSGSYAINFTASTSYGAPDVIDLAIGFQSISVPSGAIGVILAPPTANTQTITLKGVTGDTGVALSKSKPTMLYLDTSPTTIGLTAGAAIAGVQFIWF